MSSAPSDSPLRLSASESIYFFFFCPFLSYPAKIKWKILFFTFFFVCHCTTMPVGLLSWENIVSMSAQHLGIADVLLLNAAQHRCYGLIRMHKEYLAQSETQQPDKKNEDLFSLPSARLSFLKMQNKRPLLPPPPPSKKRRDDLLFIWHGHKVICEWLLCLQEY